SMSWGFCIVRATHPPKQPRPNPAGLWRFWLSKWDTCFYQTRLLISLLVILKNKRIFGVNALLI
ncbi:hypothetical protein ACFFU8_23665, partial [Chromobacterium piscinae]|uniref:hypothetical protein n=1 Tax=Chromobacterium piscinae TaxID=686831 RepID=UPI0035E4FFB0